MTDGGRKARIRNIFGMLALFALIAYVVPLLIVFSFQRSLMYMPSMEHVGNPSEFGLKDMQVVSVTTEDGLTLQDWFRPPKNGDKYTVVIFHGSFVSLGYIASIAPLFMKSNHGLFLCEYRGFGDSSGSPTEQGIYSDARAAVKWLTAHGYPADHLIFYGSSLGTGVAIQMAAETQPGMLILHSPYTSIADVAKSFYPLFPVDLLIKDRFDSIDKIGKVHAPLLILHGEDDNIIPIANARKLFDAANSPKTFLAAKHFKHNDFLFSAASYKQAGNWIDSQIKAASH